MNSDIAHGTIFFLTLFRRPPSNHKKLCKFPLTAASCTLGDVARNRNGGTAHLTHQTEFLFVWKLPGDSVDILDQADALLPDQQIPMPLHSSPVTRHLSPVTRHLSPVTCHPSPVTRHRRTVNGKDAVMVTGNLCNRAIDATFRGGVNDSPWMMLGGVVHQANIFKPTTASTAAIVLRRMTSGVRALK